MDKKNARALSTFGIENLLTRFVNLPAEPGDSGPAQQFRDLAGELIDTHLGCDRVPADRYCHFVAIFRRVWKARTIAQKKEASKRIEAIFNRLAALPAIDRPALAVDFTSELVIS